MLILFAHVSACSVMFSCFLWLILLHVKCGTSQYVIFIFPLRCTDCSQSNQMFLLNKKCQHTDYFNRDLQDKTEAGCCSSWSMHMVEGLKKTVKFAFLDEEQNNKSTSVEKKTTDSYS